MVLLVSSTDHTTGKTGATLTIDESKNGGAFASIAPVVTERGSGWYSIALTATNTNTVGDYVLHITASGADPLDIMFNVQAVLPSNVLQWRNASPSDLVSAGGFSLVRGSVEAWSGAAVPVPGNAGYPEVDVRYVRNALINALQAGRLDSYVGAMAADVVTAAALAADAVTEIATGILDATYEGARTVRGFFRVARAVLVNRANDLTTAPKYRDDANLKDRVSFTMSGSNAVRTPVVDET